MQTEFIASQVLNILNADLSRDGLKKAEASGRIPKAERKKRGTREFRYWKLSDIPEIGAMYGHFQKPESQKVIATYVPKGGVGKTAWSYNFSRCLALNGIRTLVVGLDFQCSLSKDFGLDYDGEEQPISIYDVMVDGVDINEAIVGTNIPTLDLIPESDELSMMDRQIVNKLNRERLLTGLFSKIDTEYDAIVLDCPPQWTEIITNALMAANCIVSPVLADGESYHSFKKFIRELQKFTDTIEKHWDFVRFIINQVGRNKYNTSFKNKYIADYPTMFSKNHLRHSVLFSEATTCHQSILEYQPRSSAAKDFFEVALEIWEDIIATEQV